MSTEFSCVWPIDRTQSGITTPVLGGPGSNDNEGVLRTLQSSSITWTSPSDCFVSYPGHSFWGVLPLCKEQSVYSTAEADWAIQVLFFSTNKHIMLWCLVIMALFCAAIGRDSVSLLRFPFLRQGQVFSCEMSIIIIIITQLIIFHKI